MVHPNTILTAQPTTELMEKIQEYNPKNIHIYVDLKNVSTSLFIESVAQEIVDNSLNNEIDTSIFQSILLYSSLWKGIGNNYNYNIKIFFCNDKGHSIYHQEIYKNYKRNRKISALNSSIVFEDLNKIRRRNNEISRMVCNKIPNVYFFDLLNLEADFLPYYLITRKFNNKDTFHIVCSSDKDMFQCLTQDNVCLLYKIKTVNRWLDKETVLKHYLQIDNKSDNSKKKILDLLNNITNEDIVLMMSIIGDAGDDVPGVKGLGPVKVLELFSDKDLVKKHIGTFDEVLERVLKKNSYFKNLDNIDENIPKNWDIALKENEVITRAFKLISFEYLCKWLENGSSLYSIDKLKDITSILNFKETNKDEIFVSVKPLYNGLKNLKSLKLGFDDLIPLFV